MKTIRLLFVTFCVLFLVLARPALAAEPLRAYFAGVSPFLQKNERDAAFQQISLLVLEVLRCSETADVYDAYSLKPIAQFAIPEERQFEKNPNARAVRLKDEFAALRRFLTNENRFPEQPGVLKLPQFLGLFSSHLRPAGKECIVILLGSPFYVDERERTFNMVQARFPSDAVLLCDLKVSPFGTAQKRQAMTNTFVHFCHFRDGFTNDLHRERVERFLALFIQQQSGVAVSCAADPAVVFGRVRRNAHDAFRVDAIDLTDRKPRMLSIAGDRVVELEQFADATPPATNSVPVEIAAQIEKRERGMEEAVRRGDWPEFVDSLRAAQSEVPRAFHPESWCARLVDALVRCADALPNPAAQRARLQEALAAAKACSGDDRVPTLKLGLLDAANAADAVSSREARTRAQAEHDVVLRAGDETRDFEQQLNLFRRAGQLAATNGLSLTPSAERIRSTEAKLAEWRAAELRRLSPADLPEGCTARVTRVTRANFPPFLGLDLSVEDGRGETLRGLEVKDFQVTCNGQPVRGMQLASVTRQLQPISVVLALDSSGSMSGKPLKAALQAAREMLTQMADDPRVTVRVVTFNSDVRCVSDFTADKHSAAASLDHVKAAGDTALYAAISSAIDSLAQREGIRRLVVLSDGKDTSSRRTDGPTALIGRIRDAGIESFVIGLRSADLDAPTLRRMADHYVEAAELAQLRDAFRTTGEGLRREVYRFVLAPELSDNVSAALMRIRVGGNKSVTVDCPVAFSTAETSSAEPQRQSK